MGVCSSNEPKKDDAPAHPRRSISSHQGEGNAKQHSGLTAGNGFYHHYNPKPVERPFLVIQDTGADTDRVSDSGSCPMGPRNRTYVYESPFMTTNSMRVPGFPEAANQSFGSNPTFVLGTRGTPMTREGTGFLQPSPTPGSPTIGGATPIVVLGGAPSRHSGAVVGGIAFDEEWKHTQSPAFRDEEAAGLTLMKHDPLRLSTRNLAELNEVTEELHRKKMAEEEGHQSKAGSSPSRSPMAVENTGSYESRANSMQLENVRSWLSTVSSGDMTCVEEPAAAVYPRGAGALHQGSSHEQVLVTTSE